MQQPAALEEQDEVSSIEQRYQRLSSLLSQAAANTVPAPASPTVSPREQPRSFLLDEAAKPAVQQAPAAHLVELKWTEAAPGRVWLALGVGSTVQTGAVVGRVLSMAPRVKLKTSRGSGSAGAEKVREPGSDTGSSLASRNTSSSMGSRDNSNSLSASPSYPGPLSPQGKRLGRTSLAEFDDGYGMSARAPPSVVGVRRAAAAAAAPAEDDGYGPGVGSVGAVRRAAEQDHEAGYGMASAGSARVSNRPARTSRHKPLPSVLPEDADGGGGDDDDDDADRLSSSSSNVNVDDEDDDHHHEAGYALQSAAAGKRAAKARHPESEPDPQQGGLASSGSRAPPLPPKRGSAAAAAAADLQQAPRKPLPTAHAADGTAAPSSHDGASPPSRRQHTRGHSAVVDARVPAKRLPQPPTSRHSDSAAATGFGSYGGAPEACAASDDDEDDSHDGSSSADDDAEASPESTDLVWHGPYGVVAAVSVRDGSLLSPGDVIFTVDAHPRQQQLALLTAVDILSWRNPELNVFFALAWGLCAV